MSLIIQIDIETPSEIVFHIEEQGIPQWFLDEEEWTHWDDSHRTRWAWRDIGSRVHLISRSFPEIKIGKEVITFYCRGASRTRDLCQLTCDWTTWERLKAAALRFNRYLESHITLEEEFFRRAGV